MNFAGGFEFVMPGGGIVRSANITPEEKTGIGLWEEKRFLARFKSFEHNRAAIYRVDGNKFNPEMPWSDYAGMKEEDLKAIYAYLKTVPTVEHQVEKFSSQQTATR